MQYTDPEEPVSLAYAVTYDRETMPQNKVQGETIDWSCPLTFIQFPDSPLLQVLVQVFVSFLVCLCLLFVHLL